MMPRIAVDPDVLVCAARGAVGVPSPAAVHTARAIRDHVDLLDAERVEQIDRLVAAWLDSAGGRVASLRMRETWLIVQKALRARYPHLASQARRRVTRSRAALRVVGQP